MITVKDRKSFITAIVVGIFQFVWFYSVVYYTFNHDILISQNIVTWDNITIKFIEDYCVMLLFPTIIIILNKNHLSDFKLCWDSKKEIFFLVIVVIILFLLHNNFTVTGVYKIYFYVVVVAFGEEFIYRGFLYNKLKDNSKLLAIILSGILWGITHAILPSIIHNVGIGELLLSMCDQIGGGIIMGWCFIYIQEKSKTLWIPILIHAILDYTVGSVGTFIAIGAFIYFRLKSKHQLQ